MLHYLKKFTLAIAATSLATGLVSAQQAAPVIEDELVLITPVAKTLTDPALADFAKYAKETWNINLKTSALAAGTPVAYGRILEWKGRPEVDIVWGGESALYDKLAEQKLLVRLDLPKAVMDAIPATIGKPKPIYLKDPKGFWTGTVLEPYGLVYQPTVLKRLGVPEPKDWDDLLHPKLKGQVAQCAPSRSSSSHATYEVILQRDGDEKGWAWLKRLGANTGMFTARSRDVPSVVARGEFAAGFAVPSYMAFEDRLAGFDIKFVAPKTAWITPEPIAVLAGAKHPKAARAFIEYLLSERGQRVAMERGVFPITPKFRVQGAAGSRAEMAVEFTGGIRSYFDIDVTNIYEDDKAQGRYEQVNEQFRKDIESVWDQLKR
ncbi:MAG: extracellular solute-binding protein [Rhodoferax sp.]|uniref:extracellular solute-binding protein n=1 Tax=Rhodoferax sp. TaxID=50421 RepID=UPI00261DFE63|nr:extracellular solute-binding protein [Rhodoferax sp.]MDD5332656.1 extracellular solute-binding protein [Rhodoferax sp.]